MPALETKPQMDPAVAHGEAFLAALGRVGLTAEDLRSDFAQMTASDLAHVLNQITEVDSVSQRGPFTSVNRPFRVFSRSGSSVRLDDAWS